MTKNRIRFLISLMAVAVIGFIGFQWYVIKEAIRIRNDQFNLRVAEAVKAVVHRLEKDEIIFLLQHRIDRETQKSKLEQMKVVDRSKPSTAPKLPRVGSEASYKDSLFVANIPKEEKLVHADVLVPNFQAITDYQNRIIEDFFRIQEMGIQGIDDFMLNRLEEDRNIELAYLFSNMFPKSQKQLLVPQKSTTTSISQQDKTENRPVAQELAATPTTSNQVDLLHDVFREIVYAKRPIHERVNRFLLDSMLKKEFIQSGIALPYEFAVKTAGSSATLFTTAKLPSLEWDEYAYKTTLFPSQSTGEVSQLYVYFPGKEQFVIGTIFSLLAGSGVMVIGVLGIFYIAISTIVKQKQLSEMKNDFINNMTHEFKTPISTIALAVDMAKESPNANRFLNIIKEENHRLGNHVEKVLQTALIDRGEIKLKSEPVNIHDSIIHVLNGFEMTLEQLGGETVLELDATQEIVMGDEVHLQGVIRNLIDNAIKYSPDKPIIKLSTANTAQGISISIADKGLGMSKEQQQRVFDKFYRVSTGDRHDVKGFGLGLSYAKEMVHLHQGTIEVVSKMKEGSTFTVWLPQDINT